MFKGRKLLIATKHQKEKVIAPLLQKGLGVECIVPENFDTDVLGTFTGEVERKDDPITTARNKCLLTMELYDCDLAIASEGSFGPHPSMFFVQADDEMLLFIDKKNDLEIIARELTTDTNFNGKEIKTEKQLKKFAVETEMRAMYNPTRMKVIEKATKKLVDKINSCCIQCNTPGFGITDAKEGLPCNLCGSPTRSTLYYI